jgi:hypothetical protein
VAVMTIEFWVEYETMDGRAIPRLRQGPFKTEKEALASPLPAVRYAVNPRILRVEAESAAAALLNKVIP